jgi:plasmid stabilization system protein ParE
VERAVKAVLFYRVGSTTVEGIRALHSARDISRVLTGR